MRDKIHGIRRRKLALYGDALGEPSWMWGNEGGEMGDFDYVSQLSAIAERAPAHLPLEIGARRRLSDLGLIGHVIKNCGSLSAAFEIWRRHESAIGEPVRTTSEIGDGDEPRWHLWFNPLPFLSEPLARFCVKELCATFFSFGREVTGHHFGDFVVELPHPVEPGVDIPRYFPCEVIHGRQRARIIGPLGALTMSPEPPGINGRNLLEHLHATSGNDPRRWFGETSARLRHHLAGTLNTGPTLAGAARALGLSERTLVRRLAEEGTRFGEVLGDLRREYAQALLEDGSLRAKQIAHAVGYRDENCLRRAFVQWTGRPMGRWKRQAAE